MPNYSQFEKRFYEHICDSMPNKTLVAALNKGKDLFLIFWLGNCKKHFKIKKKSLCYLNFLRLVKQPTF